MKQQLHFITIGVDDLSAMKNFYTYKFGWEWKCIGA
ncbi:MAG TPA: VOC family protein [Cyclobacteriaceae bacterium]|nr:VOC family protein [Cyclobacteriaceae bacterium]